ncbi:MAG TPA: asparagine synthase (glutamine-hydrolyzing), partial [Bdellovibrionales bacterium]|nr:asparagine synthase (glutamine-hydrolyzing) [Bdellovibrionales bacterium]
MCGIGAILRRGPDAAGPVAELTNSINKMCSQLRHRGPDGAGYAVIGGGAGVLGHVRLSVIDLEGGRQPMHNEDGSVTITYNGEIYDYKDHRAKLEAAGHVFRTQSDTEVIVHMYEEYGLGFLEHLNGEFAFVLWDETRKRLVAATDRFAIKPLHYRLTARHALFASEAKAIFAAGLESDLQAGARSFSNDFLVGPLFGAFPDGITLFENVASLPAAHRLVIEGGRAPRLERYWMPAFATDEAMTFEAARDGVRTHFENAVRRRQIADVDVGTYLSGGLDSTLVCGLMSKHTRRLKAFNVGFGGTEFDESGLARKIADHFGAEFESVNCDERVLLDNLVTTLWHVEKPIANSNAVAKFVLSKLTRERGYKVVVTGEGSDEVFGGYPYFKQERIWRMRDRRRANLLMKRFRALERRSESLLWT